MKHPKKVFPTMWAKKSGDRAYFFASQENAENCYPCGNASSVDMRGISNIRNTATALYTDSQLNSAIIDALKEIVKTAHCTDLDCEHAYKKIATKYGIEIN